MYSIQTGYYVGMLECYTDNV